MIGMAAKERKEHKSDLMESVWVGSHVGGFPSQPTCYFLRSHLSKLLRSFAAIPMILPSRRPSEACLGKPPRMGGVVAPCDTAVDSGTDWLLGWAYICPAKCLAATSSFL